MDILNRIETLKNKLQLVKEDLSLLPQVDTPSVHHFTDGVYTRETFMPKGTFAIGKRHRFKVLNILLKGEISVLMDSSEEVIHLKAPCIFESEAGVAKVAYFHADTVWLNIHPTEETDLSKIEAAVIIDDNEELIWHG